MPRTAPPAPSVALVGLCLALAACSGGTPQEDPAAPPPAPTVESDDVATLETEEEAREAPSSEVVDPLVERYGEPVRLRLDFSDEEEAAAYARFDECVAGESGVDPTARRQEAAGDPADVGPATVDGEEAAALEAAHEACMVVAPLPPWEWDVQNPDAVDFAQAVVDCLHGAGVQYVEVTQDAGQVTLAFGGEDNHGPSISLGLENFDRCEQEAAASGAGG